ncbi:MAG: hypothetical protein HY711_03120, partial [Candidatus Melainabacteria bacterium]|nr:hypothetical protein [Candidatus Melainabacteria bacterium]
QDFLDGLKAKLYAYPEDDLNKGQLPDFFNVNTPYDYSEILLRSQKMPCRGQSIRTTKGTHIELAT